MSSRDIETTNRLYERLKTIIDLPDRTRLVSLTLEVGQAPIVVVERYILEGEGSEGLIETKRFRIVDPEEAE